MTKQINKNWKFSVLTIIAIFIVSGAFGAIFGQDKYPKPDFSAMEEYYDIDSYEYDFADRKFRVVARPKQTVVPIWWNITWLDGKGLKIESFTIYFGLGEVNRVKVGEAVQGSSYCPFKRFMPRAKSISIEENPDGGEAKTADYGTNTQAKKAEKTIRKSNGVTQLTTGTAWSLRMYRKSEGYSNDGTIQTMLFCPDGNWDTVRSGFGTVGAVGQRGTYKMTGKNLTLRNGQGGQTETYAISSFAAGIFELSDGSDIVWRLFDGIKADCK